MISPNYKRATNMAYKTIIDNLDNFMLPINVIGILKSLKNVKLKPYSKVCNEFDYTYEELLDFFPSEYGFNLYDDKNGNYLVLYNDYKEETTVFFTLAHELGHIILKHKEDTNINNKEADCFARNLLCTIPIVDDVCMTNPDDYMLFFEISEPMADVSLNFQDSDRYYIKDYYYEAIKEAFSFITHRTDNNIKTMEAIIDFADISEEDMIF